MALRHVLFWGGTGQARVLNEALDKSIFKLVLIVDQRKIESPVSNVPIVHGRYGFETWLENYSGSKLYFSIAIGGGHGDERIEIANYLRSKGAEELTVIHSTAFVAKDTQIGSGSQILAMSSVCANVRIGRQVIINTGASVDHDCILSEGVHIGPGAILTGSVTVERNVFVGAGAVILPHLTIGSNALVGAGSVVTKSVAANQVVLGNPAIFFKTKLNK
jgi:sugar O-acyltransferase (sialic acid O-acetyltransferase NeuD family)